MDTKLEYHFGNDKESNMIRNEKKWIKEKKKTK